MEPYVDTFSGRHLNLLQPMPDQICIEDIAHALSNLCRFTGHVERFYSVAEHCVIVSKLVPPYVALEGLLHDASEAYIGDVSSPLKALLPDYRTIEARIEYAIARKFGLHPNNELDGVHYADLVALATERRDLMPNSIGDWSVLKGILPRERPITGLPPQLAKTMFLNRYHELIEIRHQAEVAA